MVVRRVTVSITAGTQNSTPSLMEIGWGYSDYTSLAWADSCEHDGKLSACVRGWAQHHIQFLFPGVYWVLK
jgi:hypothetical protein